jgi:hypothetical protein
LALLLALIHERRRSGILRSSRALGPHHFTALDIDLYFLQKLLGRSLDHSAALGRVKDRAVAGAAEPPALELVAHLTVLVRAYRGCESRPLDAARSTTPTRTSRLWRTTSHTQPYPALTWTPGGACTHKNAGLRVRGCVEGERACNSGSQWYRSGWCWSHLVRRRDRWETRTPGSPCSRLCRRCLWYRPCRLHPPP